MNIDDILADDLEKGLFFDGCSKLRVIDGVELDVDELDEGEGASEGYRNNRREGVSIQVSVFLWREADLAKPKPRQQMIIDGVKWTVSKSEAYSGFVEVQMYREKS